MTDLRSLQALIQQWRTDVEAHQFVNGPRAGEAESVRSNRAYNNALVKCISELEAALVLLQGAG